MKTNFSNTWVETLRFTGGSQKSGETQIHLSHAIYCILDFGLVGNRSLLIHPKIFLVLTCSQKL